MAGLQQTPYSQLQDDVETQLADTTATQTAPEASSPGEEELLEIVITAGTEDILAVTTTTTTAAAPAVNSSGCLSNSNSNSLPPHPPAYNSSIDDTQASLPNYEMATSWSSVVLTINHDQAPPPSYTPPYDSGGMSKLNIRVDVLYSYRCIRVLDVVVSALMFIYFIYCIVIGTLYIDDDCDAPLAIWLIIYGALSLIIVITKSLYLRLKCDDRRARLLKHLVSAFVSICIIVSIWNIVGVTWVLQMFMQSTYTCPVILSQTGFWTVITSLEFLFVFIFSSIVGCIVHYFTGCCRYY